MTRKLRWGVIGAAGINQSVIPAIQASSTGSVTAIASRNLEKAQKAAEKFNIPTAYGSYEEILLDDQIDAVYIPLPNHLHKDWAIRAAQAGKHVLCEKPLALNAEEAQEMVDACAKANVKLAEAFMHRHNPRLERIKEIIASGEIGSIRALHGAFTFNNAQDKNNVRYQANMGGGSVYDVGCYPISLARLIMGSEPTAATAHAFFSTEHDGVDMMCSGLIEFSDQVAMTFDCGMWADFRQTFEILGTEGRIELSQAFLPSPDAADFTVIVKGERREEKVVFQNPYTLQADNFARAILDDQPLLYASQDAVLNMRVIDAVLKSAKEKVRVSLV
ncbi:Gfo/Idh/MocA family protein [Paenibacillus psychroresistens]|uniref:Gfo/Idh/MocA family protein n=1 Tax=Paenibacillus psychroresistens TaxID=1778678 RepID=UPI001D04E1D3|nr:Gfo/Idh/MocA family oxidoreductase [Paenibacillus psychroresistens]